MNNQNTYDTTSDTIEFHEQILYNKIELIVDSFINSSNLSKDEFLEKVFTSVFELIPEAEKGSYFELSGDYYVPLFSKGYDKELLSKLKYKKDEVFNFLDYNDHFGLKTYNKNIKKKLSTVFDEETTSIFKSLGTYTDFIAIYVPIELSNSTVGIIGLDNFNNVKFSTLSRKILKFYTQMISNFYSLIIAKEHEAQINNEVIIALVSAIEINDIYTKDHGKRVSAYSVLIAQKMNLSELEIHDIEIAALLHDIGKIGIPSNILNKPGKLSTLEYELIKEHPTHTKTILEKISGFSNIVNYAYCHHEYYNGMGYPRGLKGDEIPLGSQIIILADVFDAITADRSYRKAFTVEKALNIIRSESSKQFNPDITNIAIDVFSNYLP